MIDSVKQGFAVILSGSPEFFSIFCQWMPPARTSERCHSLCIYLGGHATGTGSSNSCTTTAQAPSGFPQIKLIVASY